jgi:hypothetical protein
MSDEKRQTRLLPFRLRGKAAARRPLDTGARAEVPADEELRALLGAWEAPGPSHASRARLLAAFREGAHSRTPLWKRMLSASVRVPAPVAACAVVALLASALALAARAPRLSLDAPAALPEAPALRIVEAPAPPERVVTRVVYVERESIRARKDRAGQLAARGREHERATGAPVSEDESMTSYFTRVDMGEFQPPDEMKIRIIRKGKSDED